MGKMRNILMSIAVIYFAEYSTDAAIVNDNTCPVLSSAYDLACTATGTFTTVTWTRGSTNIATCTSVCTPEELGYTGTVSGSTYTLNIASLQAVDATTWHCLFGTTDSTYQLNTVTAQPAGSLSATCVVSGTGHDVSCTGLTDLGNPATTLSIKESGVSVASTSTNPTLTTTVQGAGGKTYTCSLSGQDPKCLPAEARVTCAGDPTTTDNNTPKIVGGVFGGIAVIGVCAASAYFGKKYLDNKKKKEENKGNGASNPKDGNLKPRGRPLPFPEPGKRPNKLPPLIRNGAVHPHANIGNNVDVNRR